MRNLALRESFTDAKNTLYTLTGYCGYLAGRAYDPECSQYTPSENTHLALATLADIVNPFTRYIHHYVIDDLMEKAATGDHAPKPDLREAVTGLTKVAAQQVQRIIPYAQQTLKSQFATKNNLIAAGGVMALLGLFAYIFTTTSREDFENAVQNTSYDIAIATNKMEETISQKIEAMPSYSIKKHNI